MKSSLIVHLSDIGAVGLWLVATVQVSAQMSSITKCGVRAVGCRNLYRAPSRTPAALFRIKRATTSRPTQHYAAMAEPGVEAPTESSPETFQARDNGVLPSFRVLPEVADLRKTSTALVLQMEASEQRMRVMATFDEQALRSAVQILGRAARIVEIRTNGEQVLAFQAARLNRERPYQINYWVHMVPKKAWREPPAILKAKKETDANKLATAIVARIIQDGVTGVDVAMGAGAAKVMEAMIIARSTLLRLSLGDLTVVPSLTRVALPPTEAFPYQKDMALSCFRIYRCTKNNSNDINAPLEQ